MRNEESDNHTSLPSKKLGLEHEFGDVLPSTKTSWKRHATEMADDATWLLREHQLECTINIFLFLCQLQDKWLLKVTNTLDIAPQESSRWRCLYPPKSKQGFQTPLQHQRDRELEPLACVSTQSEHKQITNWVDHILLWLVHNLVFQTEATYVPTPNWRWLQHHTNVSPRSSPHNALLRQNKGEKLSGQLHDPDGLWQFFMLSSLKKPGCSRKVQTFLLHNQLDVIEDKGHLVCGFIDQDFFEATWKLSASTECFCNSSQEN